MRKHQTVPKYVFRPNVLYFIICFSFISIATHIYFSSSGNCATEKEQWPVKFLLQNPNCHIPYLDLMNSDIVGFIKPVYNISCSSTTPLTYIEFKKGVPVLYIDHVVKDTISFRDDLTCCFSIVTRDPSIRNDDFFNITDCKRFKKRIVLKPIYEFIITKCHLGDRLIYSNGHTIVLPKPEILQRMKSFKFKQKDTSRPLSVLILGIDSVSRSNFYRSMPLTSTYLKKLGMIDLKGYNKIEDNTFPNLMAILTGKNLTTSYKICDPKSPPKLDDCNMLWHDFKNNGYTTAYAEDEPTIATFNFQKNGFTKPPTDYYYRPYALAMQEHLKIQKDNDMSYCVGPIPGGERILTYAQQFVKSYRNDPFFGLFWINSFSHSDINSVSRVDLMFKKWFEDLKHSGVFNTSMVIFLSDHGMRFGDIVETGAGWLEERLPFILISLPKWFIKKNPQSYKNLITNRNRLTNPYDLHMTLQDVLIHYTPPVQSSACPKCHSLFKPVSFERSCDDAAIDIHWCTCYSFVKKNKDQSIVNSCAKHLVTKIKHLIHNDNDAVHLCTEPVLNKVVDARISTFKVNMNITYYVLIIETLPGNAKFEATIQHNSSEVGQKGFQLKGTISRINIYREQSLCISDSVLKKYCYCKDLLL